MGFLGGVFFLVMISLTATGFSGAIAFSVNTGMPTHGWILSSDGSRIASGPTPTIPFSRGGISVGFFKAGVPFNFSTGLAYDLGYLKTLNPRTAWWDLIDLGFVDLRSAELKGGGLGYNASSSNFDWSFTSSEGSRNQDYMSGGLSGSVGGAFNPTYPLENYGYAYSGLGYRLFVIAFNYGEWDYSSNLMQDAFSYSTEWAVISNVSSLQYNYISPLSIDGKLLSIRDMQSSDIIVGSLWSDDTTSAVLMIPEPSSLSLLLAGGAVFAAARRRKVD